MTYGVGQGLVLILGQHSDLLQQITPPNRGDVVAVDDRFALKSVFRTYTNLAADPVDPSSYRSHRHAREVPDCEFSRQQNRRSGLVHSRQKNGAH